jgi:hypothetical protein
LIARPACIRHELNAERDRRVRACTFYPWLNSLNCFAIDDLNGAPSDNFVRRIANAE